MALLQAWQLKSIANTNYAVAGQYLDNFRPDWFNPALGTAVSQGGRQAAWFMQAEYGAGVLRHYRRGGLRAKFGKHSYFWLGQSRIRALTEIRVLDYLRNKSILVPEPIAASYSRYGLFYSNAILLRCIPQARTLAADLDNIDPAAVFKAIESMHRAGVWHADLNANNIMADSQSNIWLIDFDRARICTVTAKLVDNNLQRLRRSLVKIAGARGEQWWQQMMACQYHQAD